MNRILAFWVLLVLIVSSACQTSSVTPTETAIPTKAATETPLPTTTSTSTPKPSATPRPTQTSTPTPAPIGSIVQFKTLEFTVIDVTTHSLIYPGGTTAWYPNDKSDTFLDVGVLVRNTGSKMTFSWSAIGITEANGDAWYPVFANTRKVEDGKKIDPFQISIPGEPLEGSESVVFEGDTYLRMIFIVANDPGSPILFNIADSPYITFDLK